MEQTIRDLSKLTTAQRVLRLQAINKNRQLIDNIDRQLIPLVSQVGALRDRKKVLKAELAKAYDMFQS